MLRKSADGVDSGSFAGIGRLAMMLIKFLMNIVDKVHRGDEHATSEVMMLAQITVGKSMSAVVGSNRLTYNAGRETSNCRIADDCIHSHGEDVTVNMDRIVFERVERLLVRDIRSFHLLTGRLISEETFERVHEIHKREIIR